MQPYGYVYSPGYGQYQCLSRTSRSHTTPTLGRAPQAGRPDSVPTLPRPPKQPSVDREAPAHPRERRIGQRPYSRQGKTTHSQCQASGGSRSLDRQLLHVLDAAPRCTRGQAPQPRRSIVTSSRRSQPTAPASAAPIHTEFPNSQRPDQTTRKACVPRPESSSIVLTWPQDQRQIIDEAGGADARRHGRNGLTGVVITHRLGSGRVQ